MIRSSIWSARANSSKRSGRPRWWQLKTKLPLVGLVLVLAGCRQDMHDQPKYRPFAKGAFWPDERSVRPLVDGTVARGKLKTDTRLWKGRNADGTFIADLPMPLTKDLLVRGQQRFNIYCTPC